MALREYQETAIASVRKQWIGGARRVLLCMPTGSGKTVTMGEMVRRAVERGRKALWLAHRTELVEQAADALTGMGLTVGAICASANRPPNPFAAVQVASVQTLLSRGVRPPADLIVPDEAHHFAEAAEQFSALLAHYTNAHIVGGTATPERGDGCGLGACFDAIVVGATVRDLTEAGYLVPCKILRPDKPLKAGQIAQDPVDAYVQHASGRRAIVFARSVALAESYAQQFSFRGIKAHAISADTPWAERRLWVDAFRRGAVQVLVNVYVMTEGFDAPETSCCILARGCGAAGMYLQMIGRILRPAPGKTNALLLDLRGVSYDHGRPEDDREYSLQGLGIRLRDPNSYCPVCGAPRTPPDACPSCGYVASGDDATKPDQITGDGLKPWQSALRNDDDGKRAERLARWMKAGKIAGHKPTAAFHKFKAVYGAWPNAKLIGEASQLAAS